MCGGGGGFEYLVVVSECMVRVYFSCVRASPCLSHVFPFSLMARWCSVLVLVIDVLFIFLFFFPRGFAFKIFFLRLV